MPAARPVRLTIRGAIAELVLQGGPGNRLDAAAHVALCDAAAALVDDARVRVVTVAGAGRSFCEGAAADDTNGAPDGVAALAALPMPTVALLHGRVAGEGLALALACDLRCAARTARLAVVDPVRGALPGGGLLARLPRIIGPARATELALLGGTISAVAAQSWGVVNQVVAATALRATGRRLATSVATAGPIAARYAKEAVTRSFDLPLDDGIRLEQDLYVLLQTTADRREGVAAFLARRPARFQGR